MNALHRLIRRLLTWVVAICSIGLGVSAGAEGNDSESKVLRVLTFENPQSKALFRIVRNFEHKTGISVEMTQLRRSEMKEEIDLPHFMSSFDVVTIDEPFLALLSEYMVPFHEWPSPIEYPFDAMADTWSEEMLDASTFEEILVGAPVNPNVFIHAYRRDLWENPSEQTAFRERYGYDLREPLDAKEYRDVTEFFHRPPDLYGFSPINRISEGAVIELIWVLALFGEQLADENLSPAFDPETAEVAIEWYKGLLEFAPKHTEARHYQDRCEFMRSGRLAQGMFWASNLPTIVDPWDASPLVEAGFSVGPRDPDGEQVCIRGMWTIAIPKTSERPELAVEFAGFWSSEEANELLTRRGSSPSRIDVIRNDGWSKALPWVDAYTEALDHMVERTNHPSYPQYSEAVAEIFVSYLNGETDSSKAVQNLLDLEMAN
tara:strand:+ start:1333 stop:2628 length:1296 start_codon:yes stop_codon:yes gene_type:complete